MKKNDIKSKAQLSVTLFNNESNIEWLTEKINIKRG